MGTNHHAVSTMELAKMCPKVPALNRHRVRCGSPHCHCARDVLHESWRLVWRGPDGRHRRRYVRVADLEAVRAIIAERRAEQQSTRREAQAAHAWLKDNTRLLRELLRDLGPSS